MQSHRIVAAAIAGLIAMSARPAAASPEGALEHVQDAIVAADERGGRCKRDVFEQLLEIRDLLDDERDARAAVKIQRARRNADRCPASVDRALRRAQDELQEARDRVRDRIEDRREDRRRDRRGDRRQPEMPPRPDNLPWMDTGDECISHWLSVELARGRMNDAKHLEYANTTAAACTNPSALATTTYYPNGQTATTADGTWYFPNGQTARTAEGTFYFPNGQTARTGSNTWYYPNGQTAFSPGTGWYYPNGQLAGSFEALVGWTRGRVTAQQNAVFQHAMKSDVDSYRTYAAIRLAAQAR